MALWRIQWRTFGCVKVGYKSSECRWGVGCADADSRKRGRQPESEEDGEVGGVWTAGNVQEIEEEEEGTSRLGADPSTCQMKTLTV